ncbi:MAG TPA: AAA family ATPase [Candidatus Babeliales bacterium]|nr:AAA family ATPase [Candidatus Babeliales bacterium]
MAIISVYKKSSFISILILLIGFTRIIGQGSATSSIPGQCFVEGLVGAQSEAFCNLLNYLGYVIKNKGKEFDKKAIRPSWLFFGDEGTGKTETIKWLFKKIGQEPIIISVYEQGAKDGQPLQKKASRDISSEISRAVIEAKKRGQAESRPVLVCIEDADLIGYQGVGEIRGTLDQILEENNQYVIFILTTRQIEKCDPGITQRSCKVPFILPEKNDRYEILKKYNQESGQPVSDFSLQMLARITQGFSGGDLKKIIEQIKINGTIKYPALQSYWKVSQQDPRIRDIPYYVAKKLTIGSIVVTSGIIFLVIQIIRPLYFKKPSTQIVSHELNELLEKSKKVRRV